MTGTLKLFKRTQSEIEDGEPTTKAAAASVTTPETAYNAVPYSPESRIFRKIFIMWCFCLLSKLPNNHALHSTSQCSKERVEEEIFTPTFTNFLPS